MKCSQRVIKGAAVSVYGALAALWFGIAASPSTACSLLLENASIKAGSSQEIRIPIKFSPDSGEQVAAMQADIKYDSAKLSLRSIVASNAATTAGKEIQYAVVATGLARVLIYGMDDNSQTSINSGTVCELVFTLTSNIQTGDAALSLSDVIACDKNAISVPAKAVNSSVSIEAQDFSADLGNLKVYPNPFKPSKAHSQIVFSNLPAASTIKIYTTAGELVREIKEQSGGTAVWDGANDSGNAVASGVYIYLATNNSGEEKKGRLVIVK